MKGALLVAASIALSGLAIAAALYSSRYEAFEAPSYGGIIRVDRHSGEVIQCTSHIGSGGRLSCP
jgi:hypothetical protein